jgi:membrane protein
VEVLKERLLSFTLILGIGFLLLVSLVIDSVLSSLSKPAANLFAGSGFLWEGINLAISFGISMLLFAMIFKILPEVEIEWGDVWLGAGVTALLFMIGKYLIGLYLGNTSIASSYGAAGSLVIVLVWIYYSAQILFLGAEFTQVYANRYGSRIVPEPGAKFVSEATRAEQGIPHKKKEEQKLEMESQGAKVGTQARPATGTSPLAARYQPNQALLPEARPSLLALSAIAASLIGFIGGLFIKRR